MIFKLNELHTSKEIVWNFNVDETHIFHDSLDYDVIIGLDIMTELGLIVNYKAKKSNERI